MTSLRQHSASIDWHPLAWEMACRCGYNPQSDGASGNVETAYQLRAGEVVRGCGATTNEASQSLARKLTRWAECQQRDRTIERVARWLFDAEYDGEPEWEQRPGKHDYYRGRAIDLLGIVGESR